LEAEIGARVGMELALLVIGIDANRMTLLTFHDGDLSEPLPDMGVLVDRETASESDVLDLSATGVPVASHPKECRYGSAVRTIDFPSVCHSDRKFLIVIGPRCWLAVRHTVKGFSESMSSMTTF
jgi:hypothetical protein